MGKNVCRCPSPPGGEARCPADQLAICRIVDGEIQTDCLTPPASSMTSQSQLLNWALSAITGESRSEHALVDRSSARLLQRAAKTNGEGETVDVMGQRVSFRLTAEMRRAILREERDDDRGSSSAPSSPVLA